MRRVLDPPNCIMPSLDLCQRILICSMDNYQFGENTTYLDSHANMCLFGKNCIVISETGRTVDVNAFAEEVGGLNEVPIVDDVIVAYDCPRSTKVFLLVARNVLYVESMENYLVPPFLLREAGLQVNDVLKVHWIQEMTEDVHTIQELESGLFIPLRLQGTFSVFDSRKPSEQDITDDELVFITPEGSSWNPHCESYADNEASLTNFRGEVLASSYRYKDMLKSDDFPSINTALGEVETHDRLTKHGFDVMINSVQVHVSKSIFDHQEVQSAMSAVCSAAPALCSIDVNEIGTSYDRQIKMEDDDVAIKLSSISNTLDPVSFCDALVTEAAIFEYKASIGMTKTAMFDDEADFLFYDEEPISLMIDLNDLENLYNELEAKLSSANSTNVSATAEKSKGASAEYLSKIWCIDIDTTRRTINSTTQRLQREDPDHLPR